MFRHPARIPQAHGRQPEPSAKCPHPPSCGMTSVNRMHPNNCMYSIVRNVPIFRVANRAKRSALPQHSAVANPRRIPILRFYDFVFLGSLQPQFRHDFLQVFPDFSLGVGIPQEIRGMIRGHELSSAPLQPLPTKLRNALWWFPAGSSRPPPPGRRSLWAESHQSGATNMANRSPLRPARARDSPAAGTSRRCRCTHPCAASPWPQSSA